MTAIPTGAHSHRPALSLSRLDPRPLNVSLSLAYRLTSLIPPSQRNIGAAKYSPRCKPLSYANFFLDLWGKGLPASERRPARVERGPEARRGMTMHWEDISDARRFYRLGTRNPDVQNSPRRCYIPHPLPTQSKCPSSGGTSEGVLDESEGRYTSGNTRPGLSSGIGAANEGRKGRRQTQEKGRREEPRVGCKSPLFCTGAPGTIYLCPSRDGLPSDGFGAVC